MIEIKTEKIGETNHETFSILQDGFNGVNGWVQMECRLSDMESEGEVLFIDVSDYKVAKNGRYAPITMDKTELKQFIDYLKTRYNEMP